MARLFTALEIPATAGFQLSLLKGGLPGARWIDPANYHVTLRFIGDIDGRTADEVAAALDRVYRPPFVLSLRGLHCFASGRVPQFSPAGIGAMLYVGIVPSVLATLLYMRGVALAGPARAGQFIHLLPVYGAVLSVVFLGEALHPYHVVGFGLILAGILLAGRK